MKVYYITLVSHKIKCQLTDKFKVTEKHITLVNYHDYYKIKHKEGNFLFCDFYLGNQEDWLTNIYHKNNSKKELEKFIYLCTILKIEFRNLKQYIDAAKIYNETSCNEI